MCCQCLDVDVRQLAREFQEMKVRDREREQEVAELRRHIRAGSEPDSRVLNLSKSNSFFCCRGPLC